MTAQKRQKNLSAELFCFFETQNQTNEGSQLS